MKLAIAEMYVMGVSTRKVTEVTEQLCGLEISATQVSRVAGMLDEELEEYPIVYLDARLETRSREWPGVGRRANWREFLADLHKRGLRGVELFVSDDHEGLKAARRAVYPSVPWKPLSVSPE